MSLDIEKLVKVERPRIGYSIGGATSKYENESVSFIFTTLK